MNEQAVDVDRLQHMCTIARMLEHPPGEPPDLGEFAARIRQADMTLGQADISALLYGPEPVWPAYPLYSELRATLRLDHPLVVTRQLVQFLQDYLADRQVSSALDPCCGLGSLLRGLVSLPAVEVLGFTESREALELARIIEPDLSFETKFGDPFDMLRRQDRPFDLITSCLPYGLLQGKSVIRSPEGGYYIVDPRLGLLIVEACKHLSTNGEAIFLVSEDFFRDRYAEVREALTGTGLQLDAVVSVPRGRAVVGGSMPTNLIFLLRSAAAHLFVAELPDDPERRRALISNLQARRQGEDPGLGSLVEPQHFMGYRAFQADERVRLLAKPLALQATPLARAATEINIGSESDFKLLPNAIVLHKYYRSEDPSPDASGTAQEPTSCAQVVLNPEIALADYVSSFLNSPLGIAILEQMSFRNPGPHCTREEIEQIQLYLPDLPGQLEAIRLDSEFRALGAELNELQESLWAAPNAPDKIRAQLDRIVRQGSQGESFDRWLESLPFPLATILWTYHVCTHDPKTRCEHLLNFFEALSEFTATILLSAIKNDPDLLRQEWPALKASLPDDQASLAKTGFGTWNEIGGRLAKVLRGMLSSKGKDGRLRCQEVFRAHDAQLLAALTSRKLVTVLSVTNGWRNLWKGHPGIVSPSMASSRCIILEQHLLAVREIFGSCWSRCQLILPGAATFAAGVHRYQAQRLMGTRTPFPVVAVELEDDLEDGQLYLIAAGEHAALQLMPFVKVMPSPQTAQNACYYYSRRQDDLFRFVSYHFELEADITMAFRDTAQAIQALADIAESVPTTVTA